jgi:hypothetical protein
MEIRLYFVYSIPKSVRWGILLGHSKSLWTAVKIAKDLNTQTVPLNMTLEGKTMPPNFPPDAFADFFDKKISSNKIVVEDLVYNGKNRVISSETMFMTLENINESIKTIKVGTGSLRGY